MGTYAAPGSLLKFPEEIQRMRGEKLFSKRIKLFLFLVFFFCLAYLGEIYDGDTIWYMVWNMNNFARKFFVLYIYIYDTKCFVLLEIYLFIEVVEEDVMPRFF